MRSRKVRAMKFIVILFVLLALPAPGRAQLDSAGLRSGEGMGQGKLAEENGFPGPKHVLDLAKELDLTPEQLKAVKAVYAEMQTRAKELGAHILRIEGELKDGFEQKMLSERSVRDDAEQIGRLNGRLRATHLVAHLKTKAILTPKQLDRYHALRAAPEKRK
jgi:Spy/CpxP family protein refolding chaperone